MALPLLLLTACGDLGLLQLEYEEPAGAVSIVPPGDISFDRTSPDGPPADVEVSIVSTGDVEVYVSAVWVDNEGAFVFDTNEDLPFPKTMDPGASIPITLWFAPDSDRAFTGTLVVETGESGGETVERTIRGTGCADPNRDGRC